MRKRFAIFDLDGTLLDTERLYTVALNQLLAPFGHSITPQLKARMMGRASEEAAQMVIDEYELPLTAGALLAQRDPLMWQLSRSAPEIPGASTFVGALSGRGVPLALATSSARELALHKLGERPLADYFGVRVFGDEPVIRHLKPAPDIFIEAARRMGADPAATLVFEDSPAGIEAARRAGMDVVVVADATFGPQIESGAGMDVMAAVNDFLSLDPATLFE